MDDMREYEMHIKDIFRFQDGRTVLIGPVNAHPMHIGSQTSELLVDGVHRQLVKLEGEMMPTPPPTNGYRSVSTTANVDLTKDEIGERICILRMMRMCK